MAPEGTPGAALEERPDTERQKLQGLEGTDRAQAEIEIANRNATKVADIRCGIQDALEHAQADGDDVAAGAIESHQGAIEEVTSGYDAVEVKDFGGGKLGDNHVGTHSSRVDRDLFRFGVDTDTTEEVILHEDGDSAGTVGHAHQSAHLETLAVDSPDAPDGSLGGSELLEGENEAGLSAKLRGSVNRARDGQPPSLYGSGQRKVAPHYSAVRDYVRNGADRVDTQVKIFRQTGTSRDRMLELMTNAGYDEGMQQEVVERAGKQYDLAA